MAAIATTYFEAGRSLGARVAERNGEILAEQPARRRGVPTPEFYFTRSIDNSRLVKAADPSRVRQMRVFGAAVTVLFTLIMVYGLQSSYRVEARKQVRVQLGEENRQLHLAEAQLTEPGRIDGKARDLGLAQPAPGQVVHPSAHPDAAAPSLAQVVVPVTVQ